MSEPPVPQVEGTVEDDRVPLAARAPDRLRDFVRRRERLDGDIADLQEGKRELAKEVKSAGFDPKGFNELIRRRRMGARAWDDLDDVAAMYGVAVGGLDMGTIDGGELSARPALPAPTIKALGKQAEADAWANGDIG